MLDQPLDIALCAGEVVVGTDDVGVVGKKAFAKMRTQKAGAPGYQHTRF